jgi:hypothetical protein
MICERLLKEQELRLRYEYETVLNKRLEGNAHCFSSIKDDDIACRTTRAVRAVRPRADPATRGRDNRFVLYVCQSLVPFCLMDDSLLSDLS